MENFLRTKTKEFFSYLPDLTAQKDFNQFWKFTLQQAQRVPLEKVLQPYPFPASHVKVFEISYNGFDNTRIHGWYMIPSTQSGEKPPCLISFHGYGGNRGFPADLLQWASLGIASLSVDCRAQSGKTGNSANYSSGNEQSVVTMGLLDKDEYYFRQVYMDAIKAIDFVQACDEVNEKRIIINGGSQGGAIALAVCALDDRPFLCTADVPSNCHITERIVGSHGAFGEVTQYLRKHPYETDRVLKTLSYFDIMNMANKINCPVLASVGLEDNICPARLFFAAYNRIPGKKTIKIYPFNGHEGGGGYHNEYKLNYIMKLLSTSTI